MGRETVENLDAKVVDSFSYVGKTLTILFILKQ